MLLLCLFAICIAFINQCNAVPELSEEARLSNRILLNYERFNPWRSNRPVLNTSDAVNVRFGVYFIDMVGYNPDTKVAQFSLYEKLGWLDPFLAWDPSEYGGVIRIHVPISALWKPDIILWSSVSAEKEVMDEGMLAVVGYQGDVWYIPPAIRNVRCLEDPILPDMIHCDLKYAAWAYDTSQLSLNAVDNVWNFDFADKRVNGDWNVHQSSSRKNMVKYDCCPDQYADITYHLEMKKKTKNQKEDVYWQYDYEQHSNERN